MQTGQGRTAGNLAALSQLQAGRDLAFSFPQGYISDGSNMYNFLANVLPCELLT